MIRSGKNARLGTYPFSYLRDRELPHDVELWDGGTASFDLFDTLAGRRQVIIIDAVRTGSEPGTIFRFTPEDISASGEQVTSLHQVGLLESLNVVELSAGVEAAVPKVIELVIEELAALRGKRPPALKGDDFLTKP